MPFPGVSRAITVRSWDISSMSALYSSEDEGFWCSRISGGLEVGDGGSPLQ